MCEKHIPESKLHGILATSMNEVKDEIRTALQRTASQYAEEITDFLRDLVQTPSLSGEEGKIAELISGKAKVSGLPDCLIDCVGNVSIEIGEKTGRKLLLLSHTDVVPPATMSEPFSAKIVDGKPFGINGTAMYGRGTCDTKGSVCAMFMAAKILNDLHVPLNGRLTFAGVVGEESGGSRGTNQLRLNNRWDVVFVGEPSDLRVALGHRGGAFCFLRVSGQSGHCSQPGNSVNALEKAFKIVDAIQHRLIPGLKEHDQLGKTVITFTNLVVRPGFVSIIPNEAVVQFDLRFSPLYAAESILAQIEGLLGKLREEDSSLRAEIGFLGGITGGGREYKEVIPSFYTSPMAAEVQVLQDTIRQVTGKQPGTMIWPFATDGAFFAGPDCTVIGFGPGDPGLAHTDKECVSLDAVIQATQIYVLAAAQILGQKQARDYQPDSRPNALLRGGNR
jgi:succinyl-diaminopimelate desuccinylase